MREAREYAAEAHGQQRYGLYPYESHLSDVHGILTEFGVTDAVVLEAAWLHDVLEDTPVTREMLAQLFGPDVARTVWEVTDEPGATRAERKVATYAKIAASERATVLKMADRLANMRASVGTAKEEMYRREYPAFRAALRRGPSPMWDALDSLV